VTFLQAAAIRTATPLDATRIAEIYDPFVRETTITFEETPVFADEMKIRIAQVTGSGHPWLVMESEGVVVGYAYASTWRSRPAYRYALESTIYMDRHFSGKGWGTALYSALLEVLKSQGVHAAIGCIALPNPESIRLHEKLGFVKVAHFPEVGYKFDHWIDVGFWQLALFPDPPHMDH
jgi:L-amino acid N-acyltransferase YncA